MPVGILRQDGTWIGHLLNGEAANRFISGWDPQGLADGTYTIVDDVPRGPVITISLTIENTYELYDDVTTYVYDALIPPPPPEGSPEWDDWEYEHIHSWTGTGRTDGDSWYDVTVTACSDPSLVGRTFDFGY